MPGALPVAAEVHRRTAADHQPNDRADLLAIAVPSVIFAPGQFPHVAQQVDAGDMMIVADLAAPRPGEEGFRLVRAGIRGGVFDRVVDPLGVDAGMQRDPFPGSCSRDADGLRATEVEHAVEDLNGNSDLGGLRRVAVRTQRIADHPFEAADLGFHQRAQIVLTVALRGRGFGGVAECSKAASYSAELVTRRFGRGI